MTETQSSLIDCIQRNPGIHFNDLVRTLEISPDKLQRMSNNLQSEQHIIVDELHGKTHFFPAEYDSWERESLALLRRETAREILLVLLEHAEANPQTIADQLGIARSTLEWHVDRLLDAGLVKKRRVGRRVMLEIAEPDDLQTLLAEVEPHYTDRWVDRAMRLFDQLLEGK